MAWAAMPNAMRRTRIGLEAKGKCDALERIFILSQGEGKDAAMRRGTAPEVWQYGRDPGTGKGTYFNGVVRLALFVEASDGTKSLRERTERPRPWQGGKGPRGKAAKLR